MFTKPHSCDELQPWASTDNPARCGLRAEWHVETVWHDLVLDANDDQVWRGVPGGPGAARTRGLCRTHYLHFMDATPWVHVEPSWEVVEVRRLNARA